MEHYLQLFFVAYPVLCQCAIRIPLTKYSREYNRFFPYNEPTRWKREEHGNNKPVYIYDPSTYGMVGVGIPMQSLPILFDTYSNLTWLFNHNCSSEICIISNLYNPSMSNVSKSWIFEVSYLYKYNYIYGLYTADTFFLGDFRLDKLSFISVHRMDWNGIEKRFSVEAFAGQITLKFPVKHGRTDFLAQLFAHDLIFARSFGLKIPSYTKRDGDQQGELILGDWDHKYVNESLINWIEVISDSYWEFIADKLAYGSLDLAEQADVVVDTGLSIIVGPQDIVNTLFKYIRTTININPITITSFLSDYDGYAVNCSDPLSNFDFLINERHYVLRPEDYLLPIDNNNHLCAFGIAQANNNITRLWRFGDIFLAKYYTVFDGSLTHEVITTANSEENVKIVEPDVSKNIQHCPFSRAPPAGVFFNCKKIIEPHFFNTFTIPTVLNIANIK